jgi:hypothetical protein
LRLGQDQPWQKQAGQNKPAKSRRVRPIKICGRVIHPNILPGPTAASKPVILIHHKDTKITKFDPSYFQSAERLNTWYLIPDT